MLPLMSNKWSSIWQVKMAFESLGRSGSTTIDDSLNSRSIRGHRCLEVPIAETASHADPIFHQRIVAPNLDFPQPVGI